MKIIVILLFCAPAFCSILPFPKSMTVKGSPQHIRYKDGDVRVQVDKFLGTLPRLGIDESYDITIRNRKIFIHSNNEFGYHYALTTLKQLREKYPDGFPEITIHDSPRYKWRGLVLDVVRHFMGKDEIKKQIDHMSEVKLNVLHLHLSDDQAFRVESKIFPKLNKANSDGKILSHADIKEIVEHAATKGIRVVPEFDVPGHVTAILSAYPALSSTSEKIDPSHAYGPHDGALNPVKEETYNFLGQLFVEMGMLFPDEYFHMGGDEVTGKHWLANTEIQAFMKKNNMHGPEELLYYFTKRMEEIITRMGKKMIAWDEVLKEKGTFNSVVQIWRGPKFASMGMKKKMPMLYSYGYYLDLQLSSEQHYSVDPAKELNLKSDPDNLWGGEGAMWTERTPEHLLNDRIWPRMMAVAERLWSPSHVNDPKDFYKRQFELTKEWKLNPETKIIEKIRDDHKKLAVDEKALYDLLSWLEPGKFYSQHRYRKINTDTVFNEFVDFLPSESMYATGLSWLNLKNPGDQKTLYDAFEFWKDIYERNKTNKNEDLLSLAKDMNLCARIGTEALDMLKNKERPGANWVLERKDNLSMAIQVRAGMRPSMVNLIEKLILEVERKHSR